jgi:hypothetical protein
MNLHRCDDCGGLAMETSDGRSLKPHNCNARVELQRDRDRRQHGLNQSWIRGEISRATWKAAVEALHREVTYLP